MLHMTRKGETPKKGCITCFLEEFLDKHSSSSVNDDRPSPSEYFNAIISMLHMISKGETPKEGCITCFLEEFLDDFNIPERFEILIRSGILNTFAVLYEADDMARRRKGHDYIRYLLRLITAPALTSCLDERASVVLQLCLCIRRTKLCRENSMYVLTIRKLRELVEKGMFKLHFKCKMDVISHIPLIVQDLRFRLVRDLDWSFNSPPSTENTETFSNDFRDFKVLSRLLCRAIQEQNPCPIRNNFCEGLYDNFCILLKKMAQRLVLHLTEDGKIDEEKVRPEWRLYLPILEELNLISKLYEGAEDKFWGVLKDLNASVRALIVRFSSRTQDYDYRWLLEHNDVTDSESRMHLALFMIREEDEPDLESIEKLVKWSKALDPDLLAFENKKLTDGQVLQDWLSKSSKAIFNPGRNLIFLACSDDPNKFYLNLQFKAEPFHYDCAEFAGKVIALALICKVRIGIALDHRFLSQLEEEEKDGSSSLDSRHDNKVLASFFANGFKDVFGVPIKDLLSFKGLEVEDINQVLHIPLTSNDNVDDDHGKKRRGAEVDPLLSEYQKVRKLGRDIKNWKRGSKLGSGSFGEVYKGLADHGFFFAAKEVPLVEEKKVKSIEHEIGLLSQFNHENIVEYFGTGEKEERHYIFLEFVNGGSLENIYTQFPLDDFQVSRYTKQIIEGLKYLHERNVMHGDLKCANILLNENGCVKIADFGLAKVAELRSLRKSGRGTPAWSAPEVVNPRIQGGYGLEADIWSLGCTVLEMLTRKHPYSGLWDFRVIYLIGKRTPPDIPPKLSADSQCFIRKCLQVNSKERPTAAELLEHPFVKRS